MASNRRRLGALSGVAVLVSFAAGCHGDVVGGTREIEDDCTYGCELELEDLVVPPGDEGGEESAGEVDADAGQGAGGRGAGGQDAGGQDAAGQDAGGDGGGGDASAES